MSEAPSGTARCRPVSGAVFARRVAAVSLGLVLLLPSGWFGPDKIKHFFTTMFVQSFAYGAARAAGADAPDAMRASIAAAAAAGIGREIYDARRKGRFSAGDLVWNALGSGTATVMLRQSK